MTTKLNIWNEALLMLGEELLTSTDEESIFVDKFNAVYTNTLKSALEKCFWFFATRTEQLNLLSELPLATGFSKKYQLPNEFLGLQVYYGNGGISKDFRTESNYILSNDTTVVIKYTWMNNEPGSYSGSFGSYLSSLLALKLAFDSTSSSSYTANIAQLSEKYFKEAKYHSAKQSQFEGFIEDNNIRLGSYLDG